MPTEDNNLPLAEELTLSEQFVVSGQWLTVFSSNVEAWRWLVHEDSDGLGTLECEFKDRSIYQYYDVPFAVAMGFYETDSPGRYVWSHLRDAYSYARVNAPSGERRKPSVGRILRNNPQPTMEATKWQP